MALIPRPCAEPGCSEIGHEKFCPRHIPKRTIICGPPGSGKTSYVRKHAKLGDIVWDFDVIVAALTGLPLHQRTEDCVRLVLAMRAAFISYVVRQPPARSIWMIVTGRQDADRIARQLGAEVVELNAEAEELTRRLEARRLEDAADKNL